MGSKICEICGQTKAKYICQECGRDVCEICLKPDTWLCPECYRKNIVITRREEENLPFHLPFMKIFLLGFFLIFAGVIVLIIAASAYGLISSGFLIIGPIPIVFGAGQNFFWLLLLGIILTILSIVFFIILRR
ncbi:MAG: DUF131 domain-containing protein [Candidatus Bathyarchaeia archaeon]